MDEKLMRVYNNILNGENEEIGSSVLGALEGKLQANQILFEAMVPAMDEVGRLYEQGQYFIPEMLVAAQTMRVGLIELQPYLIEKGVESLGKIAIGTVQGDMHDIGKNLVIMMLEGAGFQIQDLGVDVAPGKFIEAIQSGAQIIGLSALLTTTMPLMKTTIDAIKDAGLRDQVKIIIGGAAVSKEFADQIGADGFAPNASSAVTLARNVIGEKEENV